MQSKDKYMLDMYDFGILKASEFDEKYLAQGRWTRCSHCMHKTSTTTAGAGQIPNLKATASAADPVFEEVVTEAGHASSRTWNICHGQEGTRCNNTRATMRLPRQGIRFDSRRHGKGKR